jgi:hypothetical protein
MNRIGRHAHEGRNTPNRRAEALSDQRFQELLRGASAFFASAEGHTEQERQAAIDEILSQMSRYGLKPADLL